MNWMILTSADSGLPFWVNMDLVRIVQPTVDENSNPVTCFVFGGEYGFATARESFEEVSKRLRAMGLSNALEHQAGRMREVM